MDLPVDAHLDPDSVTCPTPHENRAAHVDVAEAQPGKPPELHAIRNDRDDVRVEAELVWCKSLERAGLGCCSKLALLGELAAEYR